MSDWVRWRIYALMCGGALVLSAWFFYHVVTAPGLSLLNTLLMLVPCIVLGMAAVSHFYLLQAFKTGRVDAVTGSTKSATLIKNGSAVLESVPLKLIREYDRGDRGLAPEKCEVIFICNRRAWVCNLARFDVSGYRPHSVERY